MVFCHTRGRGGSVVEFTTNARGAMLLPNLVHFWVCCASGNVSTKMSHWYQILVILMIHALCYQISKSKFSHFLRLKSRIHKLFPFLDVWRRETTACGLWNTLLAPQSGALRIGACQRFRTVEKSRTNVNNVILYLLRQAI